MDLKLIDIFELLSGLHQANMLTNQRVPVGNACAIHKIVIDDKMPGLLLVALTDQFPFKVLELMFLSGCCVNLCWVPFENHLL